ncbi:MAG: hypothetical protein U0163_00145 [Gemmatimonadaceae bacterium]
MIPISPIFLVIPLGIAAGVGVLAGFFAAGARGTVSQSAITMRSVCLDAALGVLGLLGGFTVTYFIPWSGSGTSLDGWTYRNMFPYAFEVSWGLAVVLPVVWELSRRVPGAQDDGGRPRHPV